MSKINRSTIQKMILKEFKMIGMANPSVGMLGKSVYGCDACGASPCECDNDGACDACGCDPCECDEFGHETYELDRGYSHDHNTNKGTVSREDCCAAVMCLIECCSCPVTKQALMECCEDILSGRHDH